MGLDSFLYAQVYFLYFLRHHMHRLHYYLDFIVSAGLLLFTHIEKKEGERESDI